MWSAAVIHISGIQDAKAFEENLAEKHNIQIGKGLWARYLRGDVVPHGALSGSKTSLPHRLEAIYPGTAKNFYDVMWTLLDWTSDIDLDTLRATYISLGDEVAVHFVSKVPVGRERVYPMGASFWHMNKTVDERKRLLRSFNPRIRLLVGLLEARMAFAAQRPEPFVHILLEACTACGEMHKSQVAAGNPVARLMLMMEGLCLDALLIHVIDQITDNPKIIELQGKSIEKTGLWVWKCADYLKSLPKKSKLDLIDSLKSEIASCAEVDFERIIDSTKYQK
ncbi:hypothetical protein DIC66_19150 [Rhodoferax lacus]|uniref:Uncharacterized protein n=1 Tax=Rhodoferax lacus TaxID=2184758 RepID=A0A3E1R7L0_9BURK|nr:hypothetical protein DIC66_19150 [Rhodoferax lacus]